MSQSKWDNKKCIMLCFQSLQSEVELNTRLQIQSSSIINKITDLVEKIEMKYERSKGMTGLVENYENMFYKGLILSTNRILNEFLFIND